MTPITPEGRRRVAEYCGRSQGTWNPQYLEPQWNDLVRRVARMIVQCQQDAEDVDQRAKVHDDRLSFVEYLATGNVEAIELLLLEMLENKDG